MPRAEHHADRSWGARWNAYWFRPAPFVDLAVCRLLVVGFQFFVLLFPTLLLKYPPYTMFDHYAALPDDSYHAPLILNLLMLPAGWGARPPLELLQFVYAATIMVGVPAMLGWWTRTACLLFASGNLFMSAYAYSYGEYHHIEALTCLFLTFLAISPSGAALSLDSRRRTRKQPAVPQATHGELAHWPRLLLQWLFSLMYLSGAALKLFGSGFDWLNGFTLQYYLLQDAAFWDCSLGISLGQHHGLCLALTWFTLIVEGLFFSVLIWPRTAWFFVPAASALHLGIYATMRAPFFHYLPLFAVFVPWSRVFEWLARWREEKRRASLLVAESGQSAAAHQ